MRHVVTTLVACLIWCVGSSCARGEACGGPRAVALKFLSDGYTFEGSSERNSAISGSGLKTPAWEDMELLFPREFFFYFVTSFSSETYGLIAVLPDCAVLDLSNPRGVEKLLAFERPDLGDENRVNRLAQLLVKMLKVSEVYGVGYPDGVNVIQRLEDIEFKSNSEWSDLQAKLQVHPPVLHLQAGGFTYQFYVWDRIGSGAVLEYKLSLQANGVLTLDRKLLQSKVGRWRALR